MSKIVYVLMADGDRTLRSQPEPFGVAVTSEDDAKEYVSRGEYRDYQELRVFDDMELALIWAYRDIYRDLVDRNRGHDALIKNHGGLERVRELLQRAEND